MDLLAHAAISRAQTALQAATADAGQRQKAAAFVQAAFSMLAAERGQSETLLRNHRNDLVSKAFSHGTGTGVWTPDAAALAESYVMSIAEHSLLDQIAKYARVLPTASQGKALIASGVVGSLAVEGDPIAVRNLQMSANNVEPTRSAALVVLSEELVRIGGPAVLALFERELTNAVARASNDAVVNWMIDSNTTSVDATGDPLEDLRAGLAAAGPSNGFVVGMPAGAVADLATRQEAAPGFGVRGGDFRPGISVVAMDDADSTTVIPASRLALLDFGLRVRSAEHASVSMKDTPESPAEMVNLWQTGLLGLAVDRRWHLSGDISGVAVVSEATS